MVGICSPDIKSGHEGDREFKLFCILCLRVENEVDI